MLDNLTKQIRPASMQKYLPIDNPSGEGLWLAKERSLGRFFGKADRLTIC